MYNPVPRILNVSVLYIRDILWATVPINRNNCLVYLSCSSYFHLYLDVLRLLFGYTEDYRLVRKKPTAAHRIGA